MGVFLYNEYERIEARGETEERGGSK